MWGVAASALTSYLGGGTGGGAGGGFGGGIGPSSASGDANTGAVNVGGLNAPAYPFATVPGSGHGALSQQELIMLGLGAVALVLILRRK